MMLACLIILAGAVSFFSSLWLAHKAEKFGLMDNPNDRSSHEHPTPRGGGIGIVLGVIVAFGLSCSLSLIYEDVRYLAVMGGSAAVALLGFCSDRFHLSARVRIILQSVIAFAVALSLGDAVFFDIFGRHFCSVCFAVIFSIIWLVSITNFYNFMDGIDGLAAMQGIVAGAGLSVFGILLGESSLFVIGLLLVGAVSGFLVLNISPARIFMGDVGSYFLGFCFAALALTDQRIFVPMALVLGFFIFDTVTTLFKRMWKKEIWYRAHRSHLYQRAVLLGYSHLQVTMALSAVFCLLLGMACLYLRGSAVIQGGAVIMSFLGLSLIAAWVIIREKRGDCKNES